MVCIITRKFRHAMRERLRQLRLIGIAGCVLVCASGARADTYFAGPEDYEGVLATLGPGDTLQLAPGRYWAGLRIHGRQGLPGKPITIAGATGGEPTVLLGSNRRNTVSIRDAAYIVVRDIEIQGRGAYVDAVKAEGTARFAHHITLENLYIHGFGQHQQIVGISTKCPAWDWEVRGNRIENAGTGMYFGNSDGSAPFIGGLIEDNLVVDSIGYNLQIKHQVPRIVEPGMPTDRRLTVIRRNRFIKSANASSGELARPNVLVGHQPVSGPGSTDLYAIYQNLFLQNPTEALFQGEGNVALYNNLFYNEHAVDFPAIAIQPHNDVPRDLWVLFNTVVARGIGIRLIRKRADGDHVTEISGNAVFADTPIVGADSDGNFTAGLAAAGAMLASPVADIALLSLRPRDGRLPGSARSPAVPIGLPDLDVDFDGRVRSSASFGAYADDTQ